MNRISLDETDSLTSEPDLYKAGTMYGTISIDEL